MADTATLILLRHGESEWNALNLFTGWVDVDLTDKGRAEAARAGELIGEQDKLPDVLYTSLLRRAITTANIALDKADRHWIPVRGAAATTPRRRRSRPARSSARTRIPATPTSPAARR